MSLFLDEESVGERSLSRGARPAPLGGVVMEELIPAVIAGDPAAWRLFWLELGPQVRGIAGNRCITGLLSERDDECDNIVDAFMTRLCARNFRRLCEFLALRAQSPGLSFKTWATTLATHTAIDYVRSHPEYRRPSRSEASPVRESGERWVRPEPVPESTSPRAPVAPGLDVTELLAAQQILAAAPNILTKLQREVIELWLQDVDPDQIASWLGLADAAAAGKLVRAAVARLRGRFNPRGRQ